MQFDADFCKNLGKDLQFTKRKKKRKEMKNGGDSCFVFFECDDLLDNEFQR